jgi:hypothetical protein
VGLFVAGALTQRNMLDRPRAPLTEIGAGGAESPELPYGGEEYAAVWPHDERRLLCGKRSKACGN